MKRPVTRCLIGMSTDLELCQYARKETDYSVNCHNEVSDTTKQTIGAQSGKGGQFVNELHHKIYTTSEKSHMKTKNPLLDEYSY